MLKVLPFVLITILVLPGAIAAEDIGLVVIAGGEAKCYIGEMAVSPAILDPEGNWRCTNTGAPASGFPLRMMREGKIHYLDPETDRTVGWLRFEDPPKQKK